MCSFSQQEGPTNSTASAYTELTFPRLHLRQPWQRDAFKSVRFLWPGWIPQHTRGPADPVHHHGFQAPYGVTEMDRSCPPPSSAPQAIFLTKDCFNGCDEGKGSRELSSTCPLYSPHKTPWPFTEGLTFQT